MSLPHYIREIAIFDAFALALSAYHPEQYQNKIHLFQSTEGNIGRFLGVSHGWTDVAEKGLEVHDVPGTHHGMLYEPNVGVLAAGMRAIIDEYYRQR